MAGVVQLLNAEMMEIQKTTFLERNDLINRWGNVISSFQALPGLVGFWPMSSVQRSTGNVYDLSGQGRILTYNGNPTFNIYNDFVPYIDLDGTGDYLSRADETDLDVLGTETIFAGGTRGLTFGGWFWITGGAGTNRPLIGKATAGQASYYMLNDSNNRLSIIVSLDGGLVNVSGVASTTLPSLSAWHFCIGRFDPSTEIAVFLDSEKTTNTTGIIASIFNGTAPLEIGRIFGGLLLTGHASLCFLSANALSDALINAIFQQSRLLFGV